MHFRMYNYQNQIIISLTHLPDEFKKHLEFNFRSIKLKG